MEQIRTYFEKMTPMSDRDWQIFSSRLRQRRCPKKSLLLETGQTEQYLSFYRRGHCALLYSR